MLSPEDPNLNPGKLILTLMCYVTFQILAQVTLYVGGVPGTSQPHTPDISLLAPTQRGKLEIWGDEGQEAFKV